MTDHSTCMAGIDIGKAWLDVAICGREEGWRFANDKKGWNGLAKLLQSHGVNRVGMEATGGYERGVAARMREAGFEVMLVQPLQIKAFATVTLRRAKTDRLDAHLIAAFTAKAGKTRACPDARLSPLAGVLTALEQTEEDIARFKIRLEHMVDARLRRTVMADIARLKARRTSLIARLEKTVRGHTDLALRLDLIRSIPGIGIRTAIALIIRMPELGTTSREEAAALAGLAPFNKDSGTKQGERHIAGGRARLRKSLFAAATAAAMFWNPQLKAFYKRLIAKGKAHIPAIVACARKLLIYANTVIQRGAPWTPSQTPA